jgi:hypothetical protein
MKIEKDILLWSGFNQYIGGAKYVDNKSDVLFPRAMMGFLAMVPTAALSVAVSYITPFLIPFVVLFAVVCIVYGPSIGKLHPLNAIDRWETEYGYHSQQSAAWKAGKKYYELSKADRALFPSNIIESLCDPDITSSQRSEIVYSMNTTFNEITARDKARAALVKRTVDTQSVLDYMKDQRVGLTEERKTYEEFSTGSFPSLPGRKPR